jgi:hypothetical protein
LHFLARIQSARPSAFAAEVAAASAEGGEALGKLRESSSLESRPAPIGLAPGEPVTPPPAPETPSSPINGPAPGSSDAGAGTLEPRGDTDPALATRWATAGLTALDAMVPASNPPPPFAPALRPTDTAGELPTTAVAAAPSLPSVGSAVEPDSDTKAVLDLNMAPSLRETTAQFLAPVTAADRSHAKEVANAKQSTAASLDQLDADTKRKQIAVGADADRQVVDLHSGWISERASVAGTHKAWIEEQSDQSRQEAQQTITEANRAAKAKADEAEKSQPDGEGKSTGWWDKIKAAGKAVAGAIKDVASSVIAVVASIIDSARQKIVGIIKRLGDAIKKRIDAALQAIAAATRRAWDAIGAALKQAQALVARLAAAAADLARKLWASVKARLAAAWDLLSRAIKTAFEAAKAVVKKIASSLATLKEILKLLKSGMLQKLFEAAKDPKKLAQPIVDKAEPLAGQVPAKADQLASEKGHQAGTSVAASSSPQRTILQRQSAAPEKSVGEQAAELILEGRIKEGELNVPAPAPGEGFWSGVWRHLKAAGNHFLQNWKTTLISLVYSLLLFYPVLLQEGPKLWEECKGVIFGGGGVDRFDHILGVLRHLVNIVAGLVATTGIWALIIGAFTGPGEAFVVGAYETISLGVIGADVALGLAEMGKAWYSATREGISAKTRETYLSMFSSSAISTAITIILVILGAIASRLAKAFKAWRAGEAGEPVKGTGEKPTEREPTKPSQKIPDDPNKLVICRVCDTVPNVPADLMAQRAALSPEMRAYLDKEAGKIFTDPANPTPENFKAFREFMEDAAKSGNGDLETGLRNKAAAASAGSVTAPIDWGHIVDGEVKSATKAVGGHSTATGKVRVVPGSETGRNPQGVYEARVEIADPSNPGGWVPKSNNLKGGTPPGYSTLFPDNWTVDRIKVEVDAAYKNKTVTGNMWSGTTPSGVKVAGFLSPNVTVYPVL